MQTLVKHHYFYAACLLAYYDTHHQSVAIGLWSKMGMISQICQTLMLLGLGNPWSNGVVQICSRAILMSSPELVHFLNACFMNFMHLSTCPLLWWWHTDNTACSTLMLSQNFWNLPETKFVPVLDISLLGMPYSANMISIVVMQLSADNPSNLLTTGNLLW